MYTNKLKLLKKLTNLYFNSKYNIIIIIINNIIHVYLNRPA